MTKFIASFKLPRWKFSFFEIAAPDVAAAVVLSWQWRPPMRLMCCSRRTTPTIRHVTRFTHHGMSERERRRVSWEIKPSCCWCCVSDDEWRHVVASALFGSVAAAVVAGRRRRFLKEVADDGGIWNVRISSHATRRSMSWVSGGNVLQEAATRTLRGTKRQIAVKPVKASRPICHHCSCWFGDDDTNGAFGALATQCVAR